MTQTIAHFVFTPSGAGYLVQALRKAGRDDLVVASFDNLSFGPIDPSDPSSRAKWLENELGRIDRKDAVRLQRDWDEARFPGHRKVAWLTADPQWNMPASLTGCGTGVMPRAT
jgi:hypothetical protein